MAGDEDKDQSDQREADQDDSATESQETEELGEKGRDALQRERNARKAAEKERATLAKQIADLEKAQKDRDDADARQKGEWEKIATDRQKELDTLKQDLADHDLKSRKETIAKAHGIPDEFVDRLKGDTDAEIEDDAKTVAKLLKAREAPETDAGAKTPAGVKKPDKSSYSDPARWGLRR